MNRIYEQLKDTAYFKDKLKWDESKNCLTITFNEYVILDYIEGNYTASWDEGCVQRVRKGYAEHWHITGDAQVMEILQSFMDGEDIYIEKTKGTSFVPVRVMKKEAFEKKKSKYMAKKNLCIYTGNEIIRRPPVR